MKGINDSLDLLLDAMSNAFGSIILICLLLAINSSDVLESALDSHQRGQLAHVDKLKDLQGNLAAENAKIREQIQAILSASDTEQIRQNLKKKREQLSKKYALLAQINAEIRAKKIEIPKFDESKISVIEKAFEDSALLRSELASAERLKMELSEKLLEVKSKAPRVRASAPKKTRTSTSFIWVIVKDGKFFPFVEGAKEDWVSNHSMVFINPRKDSWLDFDSESFKKFLKKCAAQKVYVAFVVSAEDSSHRALRNALAYASSLGLKYYWRDSLGTYLETFSPTGVPPAAFY